MDRLWIPNVQSENHVLSNIRWETRKSLSYRKETQRGNQMKIRQVLGFLTIIHRHLNDSMEDDPVKKNPEVKQ